MTGFGEERPRVFVLDDSRTVLAALRRDLSSAGFDVATATDPAELGPEGLEHVQALVVDVQMEEVFGDDVVRFLRQAWNVSAPIVLYSSLAQDELDARALDSGASGAVCKTRGVNALIEVLRCALGAV